MSVDGVTVSTTVPSLMATPPLTTASIGIEQIN